MAVAVGAGDPLLTPQEQISEKLKELADGLGFDPIQLQAKDPINADFDIVIIGGGFGGQLVAARFIEAGFTNLAIIERGGDFGGTWYWNRYPGAQCDINSYIYMPLLEETGYIPTEKYSHSSELREHAQPIGKHYNFISWDSAASFWKFETNRNDNIRGKWIVPAAGPLSLPKFPGLAGLEKFQGHSFHSSRWDYAYTGGDSLGNLTNLADKRVGIIGTGATAVQLVPHLGKHAKELYVFQRTPSSIDARNNRPTDPKWVESSTRGWQQSRMDNFHSLVNGEAQAEDLVSDGWTDILRTLGGVATIQPGIDENPIALAARLQIADLKKMEYLRARVDQIVTNAETAEGLKPWYNTFFKRPCFHDAYLPTFNRLKVNLVDTKGRGIDAITERGIIANGKETELDCIIYVTGFEFASDWIDRTGTEIYGQDGTSLTQKWRSGVSTFHGWSVQNFPNCLLIITSQAGSSPNYIHNANEQACHLAYLLSYCEKHGIKTIQPTIKSEAAWVKEVLEMGKPRTNFLKECTPGYCNDEGKANEKLTRDLPYGGAGLKYLEILKKWRDDERLEGLECTYV